MACLTCYHRFIQYFLVAKDVLIRIIVVGSIFFFICGTAVRCGADVLGDGGYFSCTVEEYE